MMVNQTKMKEDDLLNKQVKVYWGQGCQPCRATKMWLEKKGVEYEAIEVTQEIAQEKNISSVPYVEIIEKTEAGGSLKDSWVGFRPDRLAGELL